jgi:hypothetical protein
MGISKVQLKKHLSEMGIKVEGNYIRKKDIAISTLVNAIVSPKALAKEYEKSVYNDSADNYEWKFVDRFPISEILDRDVEKTDKRSGWDVDTWIEWGKKNNRTTDTGSLKRSLRTPIVLVDDGSDIFIWDGHHRIAGCLISGIEYIPAVVGTSTE